jgi:hypothetical protein
MRKIDKTVFTFALALTAAFTLPIQADERDCRDISNAAERLACYDAQFPKTTETPVGQEPSEAIDDTSLPETSVSTSVQSDESDPPFTTDKGGFFERKPDITVNSTISAVKNERQKKMVFRLENGQIWLQTAPRSLPIKVGDKVTIKTATMGGYMLRNENNTSTRVRRIK